VRDAKAGGLASRLAEGRGPMGPQTGCNTDSESQSHRPPWVDRPSRHYRALRATRTGTEVAQPLLSPHSERGLDSGLDIQPVLPEQGS
jgi:hypothetical protein